MFVVSQVRTDVTSTDLVQLAIDVERYALTLVSCCKLVYARANKTCTCSWRVRAHALPARGVYVPMLCLLVRVRAHALPARGVYLPMYCLLVRVLAHVLPARGVYLPMLCLLVACTCRRAAELCLSCLHILRCIETKTKSRAKTTAVLVLVCWLLTSTCIER